MLARAFGLEGSPGWRRILEETIMTRPLLGISQALAALEVRSGRVLTQDARRDLIAAWGEASAANQLHADALPVLRGLGDRTGDRRLRLALLSNTQSFDMDFLARSGLEACFDVIQLSCHTGLLKPDRQAFLAAAGMLRVPAGEILMVGDSLEDDIEGARAAGMRALLLDRKAGSRGREPGAVTSLWELRDRLTAAWERA